MTSKTKRVLTEISKYKVYKSHETYLKEEFPCIYRKFLLRQVRQNTFSHSVESNVKSKGGERLCRTYSIAFLVSGCREPIGNQSGTNFANRRQQLGNLLSLCKKSLALMFFVCYSKFCRKLQ